MLSILQQHTQATMRPHPESEHLKRNLRWPVAAHHEEEDQDGEVEVEGRPVRRQRLAKVHDHAQRLAQRLEEQLQGTKAQDWSQL